MYDFEIFGFAHFITLERILSPRVAFAFLEAVRGALLHESTTVAMRRVLSSTLNYVISRLKVRQIWLYAMALLLVV